MPSLSALYHSVYDSICGAHPDQRPWHFQWLMARSIRDSIRGTLAQQKGALLDVGCGSQPYRRFCTGVDTYVGMDIVPGPRVDVLIQPDDVRWPLPDAAFDILLCTEVVEHAAHLELFKEMLRVAKPGGLCLATVPFIYGEHGAPHDYLRLSVHGLRRMAEEAGWQVVDIRRVGRIGTCVGTLSLNWVDAQLSGSLFRKAVKAMLLPVNIVLSLLVNMVCVVWDALDGTGAFYGNAWLLARKPQA